MCLPSLGTDNQDLSTEEILMVCCGGFGLEILGPEGGGELLLLVFFVFVFCFASVNYLISSPGIAISKNNPSTECHNLAFIQFQKKTIKIALISQILILCLISNIK